MTNKEFTRRCDIFAVFEKAAEIFFYSSTDSFSIYKFSCYGGSHFSESYAISLHFLNEFLSSFPVTFDWFYVERYTRSQFNSSYKYFLSFLSRLSVRQMDILSSSGRFEYLLKFRDKFNFMENTVVQDA